MKSILFASLASFISFLSTETSAQNVFVADFNGRPVVERKHENLIGSLYLNDKWEQGIVQLSNGSTLKSVELKFNMTNDQLLFKGKKGETLQFADPVQAFKLLNTERHEEFRKGSLLGKDFKPELFYQVLFDGHIKLLKRSSKVIVEAKGYNSATVTNNVNTIVKYYLLKPDKSVTEFKPSKKKVIEILADGKKDIETLVNDSKTNINDDADLIKIFEVYNSKLQS